MDMVLFKDDIMLTVWFYVSHMTTSLWSGTVSFLLLGVHFSRLYGHQYMVPFDGPA
jgi:hypothetical protein